MWAVAVICGASRRTSPLLARSRATAWCGRTRSATSSASVDRSAALAPHIDLPAYPGDHGAVGVGQVGLEPAPVLAAVGGLGPALVGARAGELVGPEALALARRSELATARGVPHSLVAPEQVGGQKQFKRVAHHPQP